MVEKSWRCSLHRLILNQCLVRGHAGDGLQRAIVVVVVVGELFDIFWSVGVGPGNCIFLGFRDDSRAATRSILQINVGVDDVSGEQVGLVNQDRHQQTLATRESEGEVVPSRQAEGSAHVRERRPREADAEVFGCQLFQSSGSTQSKAHMGL